MVDLIEGLTAETVRANLGVVQERLLAAGRAAGEVQILAAVKYLPEGELAALAAGGVTLAGENRAQDLVIKAPAHPEFIWDFIGALQSRKVAQILPHVRYIHSVASDSALAQLGRHGNPDTQVLIEVNVAADPDKAGSGCGPDDDAATRIEPRGEPAALLRAPGAGRRARPQGALDGHKPGLRGRRAGRGDYHQARFAALQAALLLTRHNPFCTRKCRENLLFARTSHRYGFS